MTMAAMHLRAPNMSHMGPIMTRAKTVTVVPAKLDSQIWALVKCKVSLISPNKGLALNHMTNPIKKPNHEA